MATKGTLKYRKVTRTPQSLSLIHISYKALFLTKWNITNIINGLYLQIRILYNKHIQNHIIRGMHIIYKMCIRDRHLLALVRSALRSASYFTILQCSFCCHSFFCFKVINNALLRPHACLLYTSPERRLHCSAAHHSWALQQRYRSSCSLYLIYIYPSFLNI